MTWAFESLRNFHFTRLLLSKVYIVWANKVQRRRVIFYETKEGHNVWGGIDLSFQNWDKKFDKFWPEHSKFTLMGSFWEKYILLLVKNVQRSYPSWHWRVMQNLKKNWHVAWKMTWGIWYIFTRALKSVKSGTLMGSFCPK